MENFFKEFKSSLQKTYPKTFARFQGEPPLSPHQASPHIITLPLAVKEKIQRGVEAYWAYARERSFDAPHGMRRSELGVCTSFDFHVTEDQVGLIEVNTNASLTLIYYALERFHGIQSEPKDLIEDFLNEHHLSGAEGPPQVAIVDENIDEQKMRVEFYLFQEELQRAGAKAEVVDLSQLTWSESQKKLSSPHGSFNYVYNRHTDFYFAKEESRALLSAYKSGAVTVSPNPYNYEQLANKKILCELTEELEQSTLNEESQQALGEILLPTYWAHQMSPEELWKRRKEFFFKPAASFGSKGVYRGKSISRKVFQAIQEGEYIAQKILPPAVTKTDHGDFKYDLRVVTYGSQIIVCGARLYAGQLTNFRTLGGGAACVIWK